MGKKYLGKTMLLIALSTTLLGASLPAQAAEILPNELVMVQPREIGIVKMNCQLTISSNGNASCLGDVSMKAHYPREALHPLRRAAPLLLSRPARRDGLPRTRRSCAGKSDSRKITL